VSAVRQSARREHALTLLRQMLRIRRFEERCAELYSLGKVRGFLHLYVGEEAIAAGAMQALGPDDAIVGTYREHGHALARGVPAGALMSELFGKANGCSGGRGGSMHFFDAERHLYGGFAIVAAGLPVAVGLALADVLQQRPRVTACFFGEGAAAEGEFHESLNLAALWKLPVVFLCENNLYAMGTALERSESETDIHVKARSYRIASKVVDGMDVAAVEGAVRRAVRAARKGGGPQFLELRTYRFRAHSMYDAELYRSKQEVGEWMHRDPIVLFEAQMRADGILEDSDLESIEADIAAELEGAVAEAEAGPWEPVEELTHNLYAPGGAA